QHVIHTVFHHIYLLHFFFFFNDTATTQIYTLSLHDALPISFSAIHGSSTRFYGCLFAHRLDVTPGQPCQARQRAQAGIGRAGKRSEEHTSELQSPCNLVCRLLLEKKKKKKKHKITTNMYIKR